MCPFDRRRLHLVPDDAEWMGQCERWYRSLAIAAGKTGKTVVIPSINTRAARCAAAYWTIAPVSSDNKGSNVVNTSTANAVKTAT